MLPIARRIGFTSFFYMVSGHVFFFFALPPRYEILYHALTHTLLSKHYRNS